MNVEFEELQISFIKDKEARKKKLDSLSKQHKELKNELERFFMIDKAQNLEKLFNQILEESIRMFKNKG